jgi:hypothetical protein
MSGIIQLVKSLSSKPSKRQLHDVGIGPSTLVKSNVKPYPPRSSEPDYVLMDNNQYEEHLKTKPPRRDPDRETAELPEICDICHNKRYPYSPATGELELRPTKVGASLLKDSSWYCRTCQFLDEAIEVDYKDPTYEIEIKESHMTGAPCIKVSWEDGDSVTYQLMCSLKGYSPREYYDGKIYSSKQMELSPVNNSQISKSKVLAYLSGEGFHNTHQFRITQTKLTNG